MRSEQQTALMGIANQHALNRHLMVSTRTEKPEPNHQRRFDP